LLSALDHVALVVHDLAAATAQYQSLLGVAPSWRGADGGAAHSWFQLGNMALDIIAATGSGYTGDRVRARLEAEGEGIWAIAFATPDIKGTLKTFARRGAGATEPRPIRSTHVESGEKRYWTTAVLDAAATNGPAIFIVEQSSPEQTRIADGAALTGLDHVVVTTTDPNRAIAFYGARLGLEMALDRMNPEWGARLMFFRCADLVVEVAQDLEKQTSSEPDQLWGLSWRTADIDATHARLRAAGVDVSDVRVGRKPGTRVFTVRERTCNVPTIVIGRDDNRK
jgi:catechol 2,3-dioxygenase-like lactoylglutathione lyase family enzyme